MAGTSPYGRRSGRDDAARLGATRAFEDARSGGNWIVVVAVLAALLWLGTAGAATYLYYGLEALQALPPLVLGTAAAAALVPALLIVVSGFMARANQRTAAAQDVLMSAASRLLAPAREAGTEGLALAEQVKLASTEIDAAMVKAVNAMQDMATHIGDERHRLESVAYATTDNARELTQRLAVERQALETLARELRTQLQSIGDAIPRQAQLMIEAARKAGAEIAAADAALDLRLNAMNASGEMLAERLGALDALAGDAATRTDELASAVARVEEKLDQARRSVDMAMRASETAADAATRTGDALTGAVSSAIEQARAAHREIDGAARLATDDAARALNRLKEAGEQAAAAVRNAHLVARAETEALAQRLTDPRPLPSMRDSAPRPEGLPPPAPAIVPPPVVHVERPSVSASVARPPAARAPEEDELFESAADAFAARLEGRSPIDDRSKPLELGREIDPHDRNPLMLRQRFEDAAPVEEPPPRRRASDHVAAPETAEPDASGRDLAWRDIISDMSREEAGAPDEADREEIATKLIIALHGAKIELSEVFKPRAKRRIADAAQKGDKHRRAAVLEQAGKQVDAVIKRLRGDLALTQMARHFIELEAADALDALDHTSRTSRNASPRLAAYLLLDAAV